MCQLSHRAYHGLGKLVRPAWQYIARLTGEQTQCQKCEMSGAAASHNAMHAWLRIAVPLTTPLAEKRALLPILYQLAKAGSDRDTVIGSDIDNARDDALAGKPFCFQSLFVLRV